MSPSPKPPKLAEDPVHTPEETQEDFLSKLAAFQIGDFVPETVEHSSEHVDPNSFHGGWLQQQAEDRAAREAVMEDMKQYLSLSVKKRKAWDDADPLNQWTRAEADWLQTQRRSLP